MELTKELKEKLENAESKEEVKKVIEEAGMILDDAELDQVAGGFQGGQPGGLIEFECMPFKDHVRLFILDIVVSNGMLTGQTSAHDSDLEHPFSK